MALVSSTVKKVGHRTLIYTIISTFVQWVADVWVTVGVWREPSGCPCWRCRQARAQAARRVSGSDDCPDRTNMPPKVTGGVIP